jgi:hypothetical protein
MEDGKWKMENGRWKMEDVKRSEIPFAGEDEKNK